ncbi:TonB-dependent outer membrane receptor, SusC/RagA subfamily, signature region [Filimonas lacunae]|uniref:TonB-dependent outer membrane receptor, SusC/RagA subfamily, signature region n=1 Tax=Filimonas lacunae TaxID=477680 RepID=A0A173MLU0_9BACT|nr:TonB-dependent receptor plug domain-containing protein [Filimonas lacunae]BAV08430.1 outer membrane protein, nutrient binding [Filimonas lacunae]SIT33914.1 TonB-dependent outer membrane receptor, SusC/RagA subfamily, signature region [Filimonas lacunae]
MRQTIALFWGLILLCSITAFPQSRSITGKVTDETGQPVDGASVLVKGTTRGAVSNATGLFTIIAAQGEVLVITATNYAATEVKLGAGNTVAVKLLRKDNVIDEVVVTAMGIKRTRNSLPYAAQTIAGDEISKTRTSNITAGLSGKASGIEIRQNNSIGGSTNVVIRGNKSLVGNNQALFVIDGIPIDNSNTNTSQQRVGKGGYDYGNAAADINPDDIESVNILKGAAASALYGSRASNGVVLLTTKKGRKGSLGVTVNAGLTLGSIEKSTFPKYQKSYGAGYGTYYDTATVPKGWFFNMDVNGDGTPDRVTPTTEDASWGYKFDPSLQVYQWDAFDPSSPYYGKSRPWVAGANDPTTFFEKPLAYNTSIFVDGGGDKGTFKIGYTRVEDKGVMPNSSVKKDLFNFGATHNITDQLTVGGAVNFSKINGLGRYGSGYSGPHTANMMTNFRQWWQTNVDVKEQKEAYLRTRKNVTWNLSDPSDPVGGIVPAYWNNPYWIRYENYENDSRSRYFANAYVSYKITSWLDVMGRVSLD